MCDVLSLSSPPPTISFFHLTLYHSSFIYFSFNVRWYPRVLSEDASSMAGRAGGLGDRRATPLTLRVRGRPFPAAHSTTPTFRFTALRKGNSPSTVAPSPMFLTAVLANLTPSRLPATLLELEVTSCPLRHSHVHYCFACPSQPDLYHVIEVKPGHVVVAMPSSTEHDRDLKPAGRP